MANKLSKFDIYAISIGTIGVGYLAYKLITNTSKKIAENKDVNAVKSDLTKLASQGQKLSYTEGSYGIFASKILQACAGYGTDEEAIYSVFRAMKKDIDFAKLIEVFGRRTIPCDSWSRPFDNCGDGNMVELLTSELDSSEISQCNAILQKAGIKYRI